MNRKLVVWRESVALKAFCIMGAVFLEQTASSQPPAATPADKSVATSAPTADRVGFPKDYRTRFKLLGVTIREQAPEVLTAYGNEQAASVALGSKPPYPDGSVIVMEFSYALRDANNQLVRDANGKLQAGTIEHVDVMRRGKGFGEAYGANRSGEWEYAGYRLDGTYVTPPQKSAQCAACHRGAGPEKDFVFRTKLPVPDAK